LNEKKTIWQKAKAFFKKNWLAITAFIAGVIASAGFILSQFSGKPISRSDDIRDTLDELGDGITKTGQQIREIRDNNTDAINTVNQQREQIDDIRDGHSSIEHSSQEIGNSIQRLKQLIEAERNRVKESETSK